MPEMNVAGTTLRILKAKVQPFLLYTGFMCSSGLYEFGGVFWMTYFNPFLQTAIGMSSKEIGTIVLICQISDAISNPLVGFLIEKIKIPFFGKKKGCHLIGTIVIMVFFPFMWMNCWFCASDTHRTAYYSVISAVMNATTPLMFLPHLAMIGILSKNEKQRLILGGISSFGKMFWGILAYSVMWFLIGTSADAHSEDQDFGSVLAEKLRIASYVVSGIGGFCCITFNVTLWNHTRESCTSPDDLHKDHIEPDPVAAQKINDQFQISSSDDLQSEKAVQKTNITGDLSKIVKSPKFYILGLLYFVCRSELNLYNMYQVFYYEISLSLPKEAVAYLPFIYLSFAGLASIAVKKLVKKFTYSVTFGMAMVSIIVAGIVFIILPSSYGNTVIIPVILVSIGSAVMYTISLSLSTTLITEHQISDVVVWGAFNLIDRIAFGVLFVMVQSFRPCPKSTTCCEACSDFYRQTFGGGVILLAVTGGLLLLASEKCGSAAAQQTEDQVETSGSVHHRESNRGTSMTRSSQECA